GIGGQFDATVDVHVRHGAVPDGGRDDDEQDHDPVAFEVGDRQTTTVGREAEVLGPADRRQQHFYVGCHVDRQRGGPTPIPLDHRPNVPAANRHDERTGTAGSAENWNTFYAGVMTV